MKQGVTPIFEPGLELLLKNNYAAGRLQFITKLEDELQPAQIYMIATGTPSRADGSAEMSYVFSAAEAIGERLQDYAVVIDKSTVPVGTSEQVRDIIQNILVKRSKNTSFDVVSNPEFLKEGAAIKDFMEPERVIIGTDSSKAAEMLRELYQPFLNSTEQFLVMSARDAELTKYAANGFLATKISFMNEMARLCELYGTDILNVRRGIASDSRIGSAFLNAGCGYGGSCFPKDVSALIHMAQQKNFEPLILNAVDQRNEFQKHLLCQKVVDYFGENLRDIKIAVWGLAFKPGTDDLRHASAEVFIAEVIKLGADVHAYDPVAMEAAQHAFPQDWYQTQQLSLVPDAYKVLEGADALVLITEWNEFQNPDFALIKTKMRGCLIVDGRNQYNPEKLRKMGFDYVGFGHGVDL